jgi:hypothetical protein
MGRKEVAGRPERRWKWWMAAIRMLKDPGRDLLYSPNKEEEVVAESRGGPVQAESGTWYTHPGVPWPVGWGRRR